MPPVSRRSAITGLTSGVTLGAAALAGSPQLHSQTPTTQSFLHGVASGDPDQTSVVIWTRITPAVIVQTRTGSGGVNGGEFSVEWEVAERADFAQVLTRGTVTTNRYRDYTVKVVVDGLLSGQKYYYRFRYGAEVSVVGRTRTLPVGPLAQLHIALASCSNYAFGFFNAYQAMARDEAIDFVLHLGDYIYEYGVDGWGGETSIKLQRQHKPPHETVTLADYRTRHAQYKADPDSIAMHAAHPLLLVWDDHESANNPWRHGAQNHQLHEGAWRDRRLAALQAYYEWMPLRDPETGVGRESFWRNYAFGDLAALLTLETRHTGRSEQVDYRDYVDRLETQSQVDRFQREILGDPQRRMLSAEMEAFIDAQLQGAGRRWQLLGNAIPLARMPVPGLAQLGLEGVEVPEGNIDLVWKAQRNLPFYLDTWDGYAYARERLYAQLQAADVGEVIVFTGDSHAFWANRLHNSRGTPIGVEIGTAGISSPGDFVSRGFAPERVAELDRAFAAHVPEVLWTSNLYQGYVRVSITHPEIRCEYVAVNTTRRRDATAEVVQTVVVARHGQNLAITL
ncbi:MAG: alkaline phosphatase D family protein [Pseudomonadota bacterium]